MRVRGTAVGFGRARFSLVAVAAGVCAALPWAGAVAEQAALEEVVVTATRRAESLQDVPLAVSAITSEELQTRGIFETSDLNRSVPNLLVSSPYGTQQPNFSVRGIGVGTEFNANAASPIGVYVDEIYQTFRASHGQQLYDLQRIEVLRGPQGTLYGRNTTGGAINFLTRRPELGETNGYLTVGIGTYDRRHVEGAVEFTPIQGVLGVRLAGAYTDTDSYIDNELPAGPSTAVAGLPTPSGWNYNSGKDPGGNEDWGWRATLRYLPTDTLDLTLKLYAAESRGGTVAPIPTGQDPNSDVIDYTHPNFLLGGLFTGLNALVPGILPTSYSQDARGLDTREIEEDTVSKALTKSEGVVLRAEKEINDDLRFIGLFGYDAGEYHQEPTSSCDGTPLRLCEIGWKSNFKAYNMDVRFDFQKERWKLVAGAYYGLDVIDTHNKPDFFNFLSDVRAVLGLPPTYFNPGGAFNGTLLPADALPTGIRADQLFSQKRESWAVYGEVNYALTETVDVTVGLRYTDDTLEYRKGYTTYYDDTGAPRLLTVSNFSAGGVFQPYFLGDVYNPDGTLAAPAAALNGGAPFPDPREEEGSSDNLSGRVIVDWQVTDEAMVYAGYSRGYRAGTMNGMAYSTGNQVYFVDPEKVDAYEAGLKSRWLDNRLQVNAALFWYDYEGQQGQVVDNSGVANILSLDGRVMGLELDAIYVVSDRLRLAAALGWLDSEYDDGPCDPANPPAGFPAQDGNCVLSAAGPVDVGGNPFPYAPDVTFNAGFDWDLANLGSGIVTLHGDTAYTGQFYYDAFEEYEDGPLPRVATGKFTEGEGGYWVFNASLSYKADRYAVTLWGKNLSDKDYYPFGISLENLFGNGYRVLAPPRTVGLEFQYLF